MGEMENKHREQAVNDTMSHNADKKNKEEGRGQY